MKQNLKPQPNPIPSLLLNDCIHRNNFHSLHVQRHFLKRCDYSAARWMVQTDIVMLVIKELSFTRPDNRKRQFL